MTTKDEVDARARALLGETIVGQLSFVGFDGYPRDVTPSLLSLGGDMGVAGRFIDANDYYGCGIHDGTSLDLWRVRHGERQVLDSRLVPTAGLTGSHVIRLGLRGTSSTARWMAAPRCTPPTGRSERAAGAGRTERPGLRL
jgi:hypothetical protein